MYYKERIHEKACRKNEEDKRKDNKGRELLKAYKEKQRGKEVKYERHPTMPNTWIEVKPTKNKDNGEVV
jgi:hypothetical protein